MYYEIHVNEKRQKFVISAREHDGSIYTFYANAMLEDIIKDKDNTRSFVFSNEKMCLGHRLKL